MIAPFKIRVGARAVALALALASSSFSAHAVLERAGPVNADPAVGNFPAWYQDTTGIGLEFCAPNAAEVDGAWCLLTPPVQAPEIFPSNFFDEHFYFSGSAQIGTRQQGGKAILVLGEEAGFATGNAVPGKQITFSRIRVVLNPVPLAGTYRFIHPYGEESIQGVAGERIFFTDDTGIACPPGSFDCSLLSRMGPFLLPSATVGGAEMAALTATNQTPDLDAAHFGGVFLPTPYPNTGKAYIADPARIGPVTGSPLPNFIDSSGASRNHNIFRIEGPVGSGLGTDPLTGASVDWLETTDFSLMGRVFTGVMPGRTTVERASYSESTAAKKLDVFTTAIATTQGRLPAATRPVAVTSSMTFFDKACAGIVDAQGAVRPPYSAPAGATETPFKVSGNLQWAQTQPTIIPSAVCVKDGNARDAAGNLAAVYFPVVVTDEVSVTPAFYDPALGTLSVGATSSDTLTPPVLTLVAAQYSGDLIGNVDVVPALLAPPANVTVRSDALGSARFKVSTGFKAAPVAALPVANNDAFTFLMNAPAQLLAVMANDSNGSGGTVNLVQAPLLGTAVVNADNTVSYTPKLNASGTDGFTYTVSVGAQVSNAALATLNITPVNIAPVANNDAANAIAGKVVSLDVLANDSDANGATNMVAPVIVTAPVGATATVNGRKVDFLAAASGTYTFTYKALDAGIAGSPGLTSANPATVTVTVAAAETLAFTLNQYTVKGLRLRLSGTITPAVSESVKLEFVNSAGTVLGTPGTVTSTAVGAWTFDQSGVALPSGATSIKATTANGTSRAIALTIK